MNPKSICFCCNGKKAGKNRGWQGGSVGKGAYHQTKGPQSIPQGPHGRGRLQVAFCPPNTHRGIWVPTHAHGHMHANTTVILKFFLNHQEAFSPKVASINTKTKNKSFIRQNNFLNFFISIDVFKKQFDFIIINLCMWVFAYMYC